MIINKKAAHFGPPSLNGCHRQEFKLISSQTA
jgi:hypothetical protein